LSLAELYVDGLGASPWRIWLRGDFASTLDVVVFVADVTEAGFAWSLRTLSSRPHQIDEDYALDITRLPGGDLRSLDHDRERRRSSRRCQDDDGEQLVTGWLELLGGGEA
jgi:hypothetical protein